MRESCGDVHELTYFFLVDADRVVFSSFYRFQLLRHELFGDVIAPLKTSTNRCCPLWCVLLSILLLLNTPSTALPVRVPLKLPVLSACALCLFLYLYK